MRRLTPLAILIAAACGPSVVNCPPGYYIDDDGMCVDGMSDTAGGTPSGDDDDVGDGFDDDGDGWDDSAGDCDDTNPAVNPDAEEDLSNGIDDDCDRSIDEVEQSMADRIVEPNTSATCDDAGAWSTYQAMPPRYIAVTLIRVGTTGAEDLPSMAQAQSAIAQANGTLADVGMELFVADDAVLYDSTFHDLDPNSFANLRNLYDDDGTLHLFVTGSVVDINGDLARGLAIGPGGERNHGLAIGSEALTQDRALAHLVGHAFGLVHTHAGTANGIDPENVDGSNCVQSGDALCDTTADPGPSWAFEDGCAVDANACALVDCGADANGDLFTPDIANAMSVYPDTCGDAVFTDDQGARMRCSVDVDLPGVLLLEQPAISAVLEVATHEIDDDVAGPSQGDGDGNWELGETIELTVELVNVGAEGVTGVVAQLSDNQALVDITTSTDSLGDLPVGGRATAVFIASVPLSCTTDMVTTFTVTMLDDAGGSWADTFDVSVSCDAEIDIEAVSADIVSGHLRPGLDSDFEITVRNNSVVPLSGVTADVYLSQDATVDPATDTFLCRLATTATLNAGATGDLPITCTVPTSVSSGNWRMGFIVDPDDDFAETNENNNDAITGGTTPVQTPPNLTVENVTFTPSTVAPGEEIDVSYIRSNTGGSAAGSFDIDIYLSTNNTIGAGDTKLCTVGIAGSAAGESIAAGVSCDVPSSMSLNDYYVGVVLDEPGDVPESDETDNEAVSTTQVTVDGDIDLEILNVNLLDTEGVAGGVFDIELEMRNNGTFDAAPFEIGVLFSADSTVTTADTLACDVPTGAALGAGASLAVTLTNCAVPSLPIGDYTVGVWLDSDQTVPESNENNNIRADAGDDFTIRGVDLWVHDIGLPSGTSGAPGDTLWVEYTRENIGNMGSGSFRLSVVLSTDATITTADTQACFANLTSPAGDQVTTALNGCTVPSLAAGTYYAGVIIDAVDDVFEVDETNNIAVAPVTFTVQ